jgi:peptide/nickel transport system permease protein
VTIVVFVILQLLPGGPAALLGPTATPQQIHLFLVENGYDLPLPVQYLHFMNRLVHGNFGYSYQYNESVRALLADRLPKTLVLVGSAYLVALIVAIPLGIFQAVRRNHTADYVLTSAAFVGYSMPTFWLGLLLIQVFAISLHLFPPAAPQGSVHAVFHNLHAMVLPVATLAIVVTALFSRFMRSSAIENFLQDYIRTARAKGVPERSIVRRHLLRNSLLPIITLIGLSLPFMVSGAVVIEQVFNYPGMGLLFWNAAQTQDYPILLSFTVVVATGVVLASLVADLLYAMADPRIRYS